MFVVHTFQDDGHFIVADDYEVDEDNHLVFWAYDEDEDEMVEVARYRDWSSVATVSVDDDDEDLDE